MRLFFLLLLPSLVFGQYAEPPISDVVGNNTLLVPSLEGYYNASAANNSTVQITFGDYSTDVPVSASLEIAGLSILVDNMTYPMEGLSLIVAWGYRQGHIVSLPVEGSEAFFCDYDWFQGGMQYAWMCDFDGDSCAEFENRTFVVYDVDATFTFRNVSESVPIDSTLVPLPSSVLEAMEDSSGSEMLNVSLEGEVIFIYEINDRGFGFGDCSSNYSNVSGSIPFSVNRSFVVGGVHKLFFLRSPVLREQWFRNNHFNVVVLSQAPLYRADIFLNGNLSRNFTIREFNITSNPYGLQEIVSNKTNESGHLEGKTNGTTPVQLQHENHSFSYTYEFNHSYIGLGMNNLSLAVEDNFLGPGRYDERLLSRMLSYNGTATETGAPFDEGLSRKSSGFRKDEMATLTISLGLVAFVLLLAFVNFWILR